MRAVFVIQKLSGLRGGAERVLTELANEMQLRGHEVTVITFDPAIGPPAYPLDSAFVNLLPGFARVLLDRLPGASKSAPAVEGAVSNVGNVTAVAHAKWQLTHGVFAKALRRWLERNPVDVVVGFLPPAISAVAHAGAAMGTKRPRLIASTHNLPDVDFGDSDRWDQNPIARRRNLGALALVDAVTVLQPEFIEQLPLPAQGSAVVMPNPLIDADKMVLPIADREQLVLGVGRLTEVKRFDVLVDAYARVSPEFPGWRLEIYGEGPQRDLLQRRIDGEGLSDVVNLMGVTHLIEEQYRRARVLGHPALYEGFGLSVAEAVMHRVPVVAFSSCPGVRNLVEDGASGCLVDDDVTSFASGLHAMMANPPSDAALEQAADRLARRLDAADVYDRWESLLTQR